MYCISKSRIYKIRNVLTSNIISLNHKNWKQFWKVKTLKKYTFIFKMIREGKNPALNADVNLYITRV